MDRRDFFKTVAITGAAMTIQRSEAMEILTQTINKAMVTNRTWWPSWAVNRKPCSVVLSASWAV